MYGDDYHNQCDLKGRPYGVPCKWYLPTPYKRGYDDALAAVLKFVEEKITGCSENAGVRMAKVIRLKIIKLLEAARDDG